MFTVSVSMLDETVVVVVIVVVVVVEGYKTALTARKLLKADLVKNTIYCMVNIFHVFYVYCLDMSKIDVRVYFHEHHIWQP